MVSGFARDHDQSNSEYIEIFLSSQSCRAKPMGREGNNPDSQLRPLNKGSVYKEVRYLRHPGGWLRSSHPLKKA